MSRKAPNCCKKKIKSYLNENRRVGSSFSAYAGSLLFHIIVNKAFKSMILYWKFKQVFDGFLLHQLLLFISAETFSRLSWLAVTRLEPIHLNFKSDILSNKSYSYVKTLS